MIEDTRIWPLSTRLASCLCQELAESGGPEPCFCGVLAGDNVAFDYCTPCEGDKCGMAWVRLANVLPLSTVGYSINQPIYVNRCSPALAAVFEVGVLRCAPTLGPDGELPDMADQLEAALQQSVDMAAAGRAVACCFQGDQRFTSIGGWTPVGPAGGCLGGAWTVTVGEF